MSVWLRLPNPPSSPNFSPRWLKYPLNLRVQKSEVSESLTAISREPISRRWPARDNSWNLNSKYREQIRTSTRSQFIAETGIPSSRKALWSARRRSCSLFRALFSIPLVRPKTIAKNWMVKRKVLCRNQQVNTCKTFKCRNRIRQIKIKSRGKI